MKLAWLSDLHLDFVSEEKITNLGAKINKTDCEGVIITGDIATAKSISIVLDLLEETIKKPIYFVLGNHDYYFGSFEDVRSRMSIRSEHSAFAKWVQDGKIIELTSNSCLIGHEGWYDVRFGNFLFGWYNGGTFDLNDFNLIEDVKYTLGREAKGRLFSRLADLSAEYIKEIFEKAAENYKNIIILTHVPPFAQISLYNGQPSPSHSIPFFASKVMGETLLDLKEKFADKNIIVFCGHSHEPAELHIDNLHVYVAGAEYGNPEIYTTVSIE